MSHSRAPESVTGDHQVSRAEAELPERRFGWSDMFVPPDDDPRSQSSDFESERATLVRYLSDYRLTLEMKCTGLDAEAMARRSVPPSNMSLLGLVRHLAEVEQHWFREVLAGHEVLPKFTSDEDPGGDFDGAVPDPAVVAEAWDTWRAEVAFAEKFVDEAADLDVFGHFEYGEHSGSISLREVMVHMIEEYARHMGHADFLRERIDGRVGQ